MKLDEAMQEYQRTRERALLAAANLRDLQAQAKTMAAAITEAEREASKAKSAFRDATTRLHPLIDADVAGIVGAKILLEPEAANGQQTAGA